jgi:hypothetical protein
MGRPVQRAEKRPRGDRRIGAAERSRTDAAGDQRPDAALVPIALGDDARAEAAGQGVDLEVRRRSLHFVDQAEHVRDGQVPEPQRQPAAIARRGGQRGEQPVGRAVLAEEQQLVLAAEVVIQVAG